MTGNKATPKNKYSDIFMSGLALSGLKTLSNFSNNNTKIFKYIENRGVFEDDFYRVHAKIKKANLFTNTWKSIIESKKDFFTDFVLIKGGLIYGFMAHKNDFCDDFLKSVFGGVATYYAKNFISSNANFFDFAFGFYATVFGLKIAADKEIESLYNELSEIHLEDSVMGCDI